MVMGTWADVVTTALLGTDRRPVPSELPATWAGPERGDDPARRILDLAAQHRAWSRAGARLQVADAPPLAPGAEAMAAPAAAQELLGRSLERPEPTLINLLLAACIDRGRLVSAEHWQPLAVLAARSVDYDRLLLGRALGARGLWFISQNPAWERLAAQVTAAMSESDAHSSESAQADSEQTTALQDEIDAVFAADDHPCVERPEMPDVS